MTGTVIYTIFLAMWGAGGILFLAGMPEEPGNRGTAAGCVRIFLKRAKQSISRWPAVHELIEKKRREYTGRRMEPEIYSSSLLLKNLALAEKEKTFSADYLYEKLMENSEKMRPVYAEMLSLYRSGKDRNAFALITERCPTRAGRNFSIVLEKAGKMRPDELIEQMNVFQELIRQQKITEDIRRVQRNSLLSSVMAYTVVFLQIINFAVVLVFMHTMHILEFVF